MRAPVPRCTVCAHRRLEEIETAMVMGESNRTIAQRFGVNREAARNHRTVHLPPRLRAEAEVAAGRDPGAELSLWEKLTEKEAGVARIMKKAEKEKQYSTAIAASRELRAIAELKGRIRGELVPEAPGTGDTNINVFAGDAEAGVRIARAFIERRNAPALPAAVVVDTEVVDDGEPAQGDA